MADISFVVDVLHQGRIEVFKIEIGGCTKGLCVGPAAIHKRASFSFHLQSQQPYLHISSYEQQVFSSQMLNLLDIKYL